MNGGLTACELLLDIRLYQFNGLQYLEIPAKAPPIAIEVGAFNKKLTNHISSNTDSTKQIVSRIFYSCDWYASTGVRPLKSVTIEGYSYNSNVITVIYGNSTSTSSTDNMNKIPTFADGKVKIDFTGSDLYFNLSNYASGRTSIALFYEGTSVLDMYDIT